MKKIMLASLAAGALALNAPVAQADAPTYDCTYASLQAGATGSQTYEGTAEGYVVHAGDTGATIRCYVTVNGTPVSTTPTGVGVTAGPVSYEAADGDTVQLCAEATTNHGSTVTNCGTADSQEIPPAVVWDIINGVVIDHVDPALCEALKAAAGDYPPGIHINAQGDVYVDGEPVWDCPPYDIWPPA